MVKLRICRFFAVGIKTKVFYLHPVKMCLLTLKPCNFLILDEPTNHLDIQAKDALKTALVEFAGTILLVSHEEIFYREWADRVIDIEKQG